MPKTSTEQAQTGRRHSKRRVESEQRHGGGKVWDMLWSCGKVRGPRRRLHSGSYRHPLNGCFYFSMVTQLSKKMTARFAQSQPYEAK